MSQSINTNRRLCRKVSLPRLAHFSRHKITITLSSPAMPLAIARGRSKRRRMARSALLRHSSAVQVMVEMPPHLALLRCKQQPLAQSLLSSKSQVPSSKVAGQITTIMASRWMTKITVTIIRLLQTISVKVSISSRCLRRTALPSRRRLLRRSQPCSTIISRTIKRARNRSLERIVSFRSKSRPVD